MSHHRLKLCFPSLSAAVLPLLLLMLYPTIPAYGQWLNDLSVAKTLARTQSKPLLVYFRDSASPVCQKFETDILQNPNITGILAKTVLVHLHPRWNESLASQCGIYKLPAIAIFDATGTHLKTVQGNINSINLTSLINQALNPTTSSDKSPNISRNMASSSELLEFLPLPKFELDKPLTVRCQVSDTSAEVYLHYRVQGQRSYVSVPMKPTQESPNEFEATIPALRVRREGLQYYISGVIGDQPVALPAGFAENPFEIEVR